ncbi:MAG TPA: hypothetical protein VFT43_12055, partial [Candidatus Polarisedimenticolia bacterium]|nr:hypothetical protein [Candidatus Polarisedimenticolia bacterium]
AGDWRGKRYRGRRRLAWLAAEALLGIYFTAAFVHALRAGTYASLPLLLLFQSGFVASVLLSLAPAIRRSPAHRAQALT